MVFMFWQTGPETSTEMGSFLLCGDEQLHDLHSKLRMEHPGGTANQLHKCAASWHFLHYNDWPCSLSLLGLSALSPFSYHALQLELAHCDLVWLLPPPGRRSRRGCIWVVYQGLKS
jgi:hypothetical protein